VAVKIARQPNKIALLGVPTSAAAMSAGHEGAPSALRSAGLIDRLASIGYQVADVGDDPPQLYRPDDESPRARNLPAIVSVLETLKPRVEQAIRSGALPLILSGDCSIALATVAAARRYFRSVGLVYVDRDADVNTPATTPSGCVDGMVVAHLTGRGAAELVRFWGEPPLVREPDLALFGVDRLDPSEEEALRRSALRRYMADEVKRMGPAAAARTAIERIHGHVYEFILHFDVDVISDFQATDYPGTGGLTLDEIREALEVFLTRKNLAAIEITAYNPTKDSSGSDAKTIVELFAAALEKRLEVLEAAAASVAAPASAPPVVSTSSPEAPLTPPLEPGEPGPLAKAEEPATPAFRPGEPGPSDMLEDQTSQTGEMSAEEGSARPPVESVEPSDKAAPGNETERRNRTDAGAEKVNESPETAQGTSRADESCDDAALPVPDGHPRDDSPDESPNSSPGPAESPESDDSSR
jgi:arginase